MKTPILMYHKIAVLNPESKIPSHYVEPKLFERQMRLLRSLKYEAIPLSNLFESSVGGRSIVITFDDGYENFFTEALPILEQFDFPSTVFLVSNQIGGVNSWDSRDGDVEEKLMSADQIHSAANRRAEFGSHTKDHADLSKTSQEESVDQIAGSRDDLQEILGLPVETFCYPYGRKTRDTEAIVASAGYRMACSTEKGVNTADTNPMALKRINVRRETNAGIFLYKLWRGMALGK